MTGRERALAVYEFQSTDVPCFDLMEGTIWPELQKDFELRYQLGNQEEILTALGSDFRWKVFVSMPSNPDFTPGGDAGGTNFSDDVGYRPLQDAQTPEDVRERLAYLNPDHVDLPDFRAFREQFPNKALVCCPGWLPAFSGACNDFGMVRAMYLMAEESDILLEYIRLRTQYSLGLISRCIQAGAAKYCDFFWLGDDFSGEHSMLLSPDLWRRLFKPSLAEQVARIKESGLKMMFHSCGDVAAVYEDFIKIGIDAHVGVQTSCPDMSAEQLADRIGGRLVIHGGVDAQTTLVELDTDGVMEQTRRNIRAFSGCGGYIVSNSHHGMPDIGADKIVAMSKAAGRWSPKNGIR